MEPIFWNQLLPYLPFACSLVVLCGLTFLRKYDQKQKELVRIQQQTLLQNAESQKKLIAQTHQNTLSAHCSEIAGWLNEHRKGGELHSQKSHLMVDKTSILSADSEVSGFHSSHNGSDIWEVKDLGDCIWFYIGSSIDEKNVRSQIDLTIAQTILKIVAKTGGMTPKETMNLVAGRFSHRNEATLSLVIGLYDKKSGALSISNAGHRAPYLLLKSGVYKPLNEELAPRIGDEAPLAYEEKTYWLSPQESVILYTPGMLNSELNHLQSDREKRRLFTETLAKISKKLVGLGSWSAADWTDAWIGSASNQNPSTDQTHIVIKRTSAERPVTFVPKAESTVDRH